MLERRKDAMVSALWSNSAFEGSEGAAARTEAIEQLENQYDEAIEQITNGTIGQEVEEEDTYGFFSAGKRGQERLFGGATTQAEQIAAAERMEHGTDQS